MYYYQMLKWIFLHFRSGSNLPLLKNLENLVLPIFDEATNKITQDLYRIKLIAITVFGKLMPSHIVFVLALNCTVLPHASK